METVRDLGRIEPWQESLERSLARRAKPACPPSELDGRGPERRLARERPAGESSASARRSRRRTSAKRSKVLVVSGGGMLALALLAATLPSVFGGRGAEASPGAAQADAVRLPTRLTHSYSGGVSPGSRALGSRPAEARTTGTCQPAGGSNGYVNPLAGARVVGERIDQGVDYAGSGTLAALGDGRITYVATSDTGWPGAFIQYELSDGPDAGCYVYYAEGVNPVPGLHVGEVVRAGQALATIISGWPTGVEMGWGAGISTETYATNTHQWSPRNDAENRASAPGKSFSAMIASLGGPAGKVEG